MTKAEEGREIAMDDEYLVARCPKCGVKNRIPKSRWTERLKCGKCRESFDLKNLYSGRVIEVTDATFQREVADFRGPVLVDFTAPW